jgi:hypothetical protein
VQLDQLSPDIVDFRDMTFPFCVENIIIDKFLELQFIALNELLNEIYLRVVEVKKVFYEPKIPQRRF